MTTPHEDLGYVHPVYDSRLVYGTYAEMLADTGVSSDLVGKLSLINEDGSSFRLDQVTPCIKWSLFSGKDVSRADANIYVNKITGNDDTGNGSVEFPYADFEFVKDLPATIEDHTIRIRAAASNNYTDFPQDTMPQTKGSGRLIFDSSAEIFPVYAGPFTVSAVTPVGGAAHFGVSHATDLVVTGAGWAVDDFYGKSIRVLTGAWAGYVLYLHKNTADTVTTIADWYGFSAGDTFEIVERPVVVTTDCAVSFNSNSSIHKYTTGTDPSTPLEPSILFCGYKFISSAKNPFMFEGVNMVLSACTFWGSSVDGFSAVVNAKDYSFNFDNIPVNTFDVSVFEDFYAFDTQFINMDGNPSQIATLDCMESFGVGFVSQLSMRGSLRSYNNALFLQSFGCHVGKIIAYAVHGAHEYLFIEQVGYDSHAIVCASPGKTSIVSAYCRHHQNGIYVDGGQVVLSWLQGEDNLTGSYGATILPGSMVNVLDSANVTLDGSLGDLIIKFPNNDVFTWPAAGETRTNAVFTAHVVGNVI